MAILQVLISCTKRVPRKNYTETQMAQNNDYLFTTMARAKAFCQQYVDRPLSWTVMGNGRNKMTCAEPSKELSFIITEVTSKELNTLEKPPLPSKFKSDND